MNPTWLKIQSTLHSRLYKLTNGKIGANFGAPVLLITTTGRKSGLARTNPLFYAQDGDSWVVVASNAGSNQHPAWWLNLQANPTAHIQVARIHADVTASLVLPEERERLWALILDTYAGYQDYQNMTEREMPIVRLARR